LGLARQGDDVAILGSPTLFLPKSMVGDLETMLASIGGGGLMNWSVLGKKGRKQMALAPHISEWRNER
jgi:hypothetical protein